MTSHRFEFATTHRIIFGAGTIRELPQLVLGLTRRAFVVGNIDGTRAAPPVSALHAAGIVTEVCGVSGEPTVGTVRAAAAQAREFAADLVIGVGGGSALDMGKAVAVLYTNDGDLEEYLEVIGRGRALTRPGLPYVACPTTAGTGSEVTRNAVVLSPEHRMKVSLRSPFMTPRIAVVDPELTYSLPPALTASTGLDAMTQLIEPYTCNQTNSLTDTLCREGIGRAARALRRAYNRGDDRVAREGMSLASLLGGLALANAKLGAVHGLAGPLGGLFPAPHGALCARLLPFVIAANVSALRARIPGSPALLRYAEVAQVVTGRAHAVPEDLVAWVEELCAALGVPPLREYGLSVEDIPGVVGQALKSSSMKGNPVTLEAEELAGVLMAAI